jgi:hypothetical protein
MNILIEKNLRVPMRAGVNLATDVYRLSEEGPFPTLITRTPYNKGLLAFSVSLTLDIFRAVQSGYVVQETPKPSSPIAARTWPAPSALAAWSSRTPCRETRWARSRDGSCARSAHRHTPQKRADNREVPS